MMNNGTSSFFISTENNVYTVNKGKRIQSNTFYYVKQEKKNKKKIDKFQFTGQELRREVLGWN